MRPSDEELDRRQGALGIEKLDALLPELAGAANARKQLPTGAGEHHFLVAPRLDMDERQSMGVGLRRRRLARWQAGDLLREVVARLGPLAGVAEVAPGAGKAVLPLGREDHLAQTDVAMDTIFLGERADRIATAAAGRPRIGFGRHASFHGQ